MDCVTVHSLNYFWHLIGNSCIVGSFKWNLFFSFFLETEHGRVMKTLTMVLNVGWILESLESESHSVKSGSLRPHTLYILWNSPNLNTGMSSLSLFQGIFPTQGLNSDLLHCRWILYHWATREGQEYRSGYPIPSPADLPNPGIELGVSCIAGGFFTNWAIREALIWTPGTS